MTRSLIPLGLDTVSRLPGPCRSCIRWEVGPDRSGQVADAGAGQAEFEKEVWLSGVMLSWGACGQLLTVDDEIAGFAVFAPPLTVTAAQRFPTGPVSPDAVLLTTAKILPRFRGAGHARFLIQGVAEHLARRGVRAIELFALRGAPPEAGDDGIPPCLVPAEFALKVGFSEVRAHHRYPRLRLELGMALGWKADVESALEQLLKVFHVRPGPVRAEPVTVPEAPLGVPAPVGFGPTGCQRPGTAGACGATGAGQLAGSPSGSGQPAVRDCS